ncbi:MAG: nuclear transport factor 2 family protein [Acidimicrobiales bacterium]
MRELDDAHTRAVVAIQRLQAAYADAVTRRDWEAVRRCFEPDAVAHIDTRTREPFDLAGPDALVDFIEGAIRRFTFFEFTILNATVEVDGDVATGRVYICELRAEDDGTWSEAYGLYRDEYRRRDGGWRMAGRRYASLARRTSEGTEAFNLPSE